MLFRCLFLAFCLVVLPVSAQESLDEIQLKINKLSLDMDFFQVRHVMGEPSTKLKRGLSSRWDYRFGEHQITLWFGAYGLRNATGSAFETAHLVAPPEGYKAPEQYLKEQDLARKVEIKPLVATEQTVEDSIFDPILDSILE